MRRPPPNRSRPPDQLWTTAEAAEFLHLSERSLRRLVTDGHLRPVRLGRAVRFRPADVHDLGRPR